MALDGSMNLKSDGWDYLLIENESIIDNRKFLYVRESSEVGKLVDILYIKYFKPTIVVIDEESIYNDILSGIGDKQYNRDKKLSSILDDITDLEDESNILPEIKNGLLKRIFGK